MVFTMPELRAMREAMKGWMPSKSYAAHLSAALKLRRVVGEDQP